MILVVIRWLAGVIEDGATGKPSTKRWVLCIAVVALAVAIVILACAAYGGRSVGVEIGAVSTALCTMVGYCYVQGKKVERSLPITPGETQ